jgi:hypothetical protein
MATQLPAESDLEAARRTVIDSLELGFDGKCHLDDAGIFERLRDRTLGGMSACVAFRFESICGAAAVAAVCHSVVVTVGPFFIADDRISLTVVAAWLTLIGYLMNDTIVVFDPIRENIFFRFHHQSWFDILARHTGAQKNNADGERPPALRRRYGRVLCEVIPRMRSNSV